jgi:CubicO group peptidase (beta-lactamase class C family)
MHYEIGLKVAVARAPTWLRRSLVGAMIAAITFASGISDAATATASIPSALFNGRPAEQTRRQLQAAFTELTAADLFAGTVLIAKGDKVLFAGAYGLASREYEIPNRLDTRLNLASAGKMFTAVAIGMLRDSGKIRFEDPIGKYLDGSWIEPAIGARITLANLLTHTSGIPDYFSPEFFDRSRQLFKKLDDYKPLIAGLKPTFAPGAQWSYSNTNFLLLGAVIEKVTGKSYDEYVREAVFRPAGMTHSGALDLEQVNHNYAQGYQKFAPRPPRTGASPPDVDFQQEVLVMASAQERLTKTGFEWRNNVFMHVAKGGASGGTFSTAGDLLKFGNALNSGRLLKPETLALMTSLKPPSTDYGYGFELMDGGFGHGGGFAGIDTAVVFYPDGYRLIVLSNIDGGSSVAIARLIALGDATPAR